MQFESISKRHAIIVRREDLDDILYSDEMLRYFDENVYGKGEYKNDMGQPYELFYQCWLDEVYGRTEAKKFWDHISTLDGLADTGMLKGLGGTGHLDDTEDILLLAKGLDDVKSPKGLDSPGGGLKVPIIWEVKNEWTIRSILLWIM